MDEVTYLFQRHYVVQEMSHEPEKYERKLAQTHALGYLPNTSTTFLGFHLFWALATWCGFEGCAQRVRLGKYEVRGSVRRMMYSVS